MIVVDSSVLVAALTDDGAAGKASRSRLWRDSHWCAPPHLVVETFHVVRSLTLGGKITHERAQAAVEALAETAIDFVDVQPLLPRMWQLRDSVSGYDAAYVAAAEAYECALVTGDARLARSGAARCRIEVVM